MSSDPVAPIIAESEKNLPLPEVSNEPKRPARFYEECDPSSPKEYYPLTLGTKLKGINVAEYVVLRKIGWGSDSTVTRGEGCFLRVENMWKSGEIDKNVHIFSTVKPK